MAEDSERAATTCDQFQQKLSTLLETGEELYRDPHLKTCAACRAFVIDLERIASDAGNLFGPEK